MSNSFFHEDLILDQLSAANAVEAIKKIGASLVAGGYIDTSYTTSVIEREVVFPTGLPLPEAAIAIPHATPNKNVFRDSIAVARLAQPVLFHSMEDPEHEVPVALIFLLALKDSHCHLDMLKELFTVFQKTGFVKSLLQCTDKVEMMQLLEENFNIENNCREHAV